MATREYEIGPEHGRLTLRTGRSGLGRRAGHDLTLEATRWRATVTDDGEAPAAEVVVEVEGIEVREGTGGVLPLSGQDRAEITRNLRKILQADRHPTIVYRTTRVGEHELAGELTVLGRTEPLTVTAELAGDRVNGSATVRQTRWGIRPFSAFFGALRLADDVRVEFDLTLPEKPGS
ncbi:YceI family protein [Actinomadura kijaniata]|uniref:YceI family protein n=1 Tax=Actinomadura kijaniata TaxID=46161 RepID=UPI003F1B1263